MIFNNRRYWFVIIPILIFIVCSCSTQNMFVATQYSDLDSLVKIPDTALIHRIEPDDKISLSICEHDDLSVGSVFGIYNSNEIYGKWIMVNKDGFINIPQIGTTKVSGLTTTEAEKKLSTLYAHYIVEPVIVVKIMNKEVSVLGEVIKPGSYTLEKEKNTIGQLMAKAGGFDFYADKRNIKLIRKNGNKISNFVIDLTSKNSLKYQDITLISGDMIYVPQRHGKMVDKKLPDLIPFASIVTTIVIILSFFK